MRTSRGPAPTLLLALILGALASAPGHADPPPPAAPAAAPKVPDPVTERAEAFKEAAGLLEKAAAARTRGNKSFAEQLFSSAELIVGPEALAELALLFRQGAPPRINTPLKQMTKEAAPPPVAVGGSEVDEPEAKPQKGSLTGTLVVDGKPGDGMGVVTLEPASGKFRHRTPKQRTMEQRDRQFAPRMLVVPVGSTVTFPNFDPVYHNVFSTSDIQPFDLGIYKNGQAREITFDKEGVLALGCNLHANMSAHIVVVAAPHYVVVGSDGKFSFKSLEPGNYKLRAWNERSLKAVVRDVVVKPDRNTVTVELKGDAPAGPLPDKFGGSRGAKP